MDQEQYDEVLDAIFERQVRPVEQRGILCVSVPEQSFFVMSVQQVRGRGGRAK